MSPSTPEELFERALVATGPEYRELEQRLRRHPDSATWLATMPPPVDPYAALLAGVLRAWIDDPTDNDAILAELDAQPALVEGTPIPAPIPVCVAEVLYQSFDARAVPLLALRLLTDVDAPSWRVSSTLLYLSRARDARATEVLARFVSSSRSASHRELGEQALRDIEEGGE